MANATDSWNENQSGYNGQRIQALKKHEITNLAQTDEKDLNGEGSGIRAPVYQYI